MTTGMKITIILRYRSNWGEEVFIKGDAPELNVNNSEGLRMQYTEQGWVITFYTDIADFRYHFLIRQNGQTISEETPRSHQFGPHGKGYKTILVYDSLNAYPKPPRMMVSAAMTNAIRRHKSPQTKKRAQAKVPIIFNTQSLCVNFNHRLAISGNCATLGKWNEDEVVEMDSTGHPGFRCLLDANKLNFPLEYKYVISDPSQNSVLYWELGYNHYLALEPDLTLSTDLIVVNDPEPQFGLQDFKGAGVVAPIFSLRTKESFGCGEFQDIKKLADWCVATGQRIIQTLPINDTTVFGSWRDSYPYSAISVYALHPMYLNIEKVGTFSHLKEYKKLKNELNEEVFVDYEAVNKHKWTFIHELFQLHGAETFATADFQSFMAENQAWLKPYAVFSFLRYKFSTSDFNHWGRDAKYDAKRIEKYCQPNSMEYNDVAVHFFVQYHLHKQLKDAVEYAHSKGIAIKGDIPIGVNKNSVDVWEHPELFDCGGSAGAPPDYFSKTGQVWGFPIYNWDEMAKDGYQWWKNRLKSMATYFDAYRIDHILGFFRIFRTPNTSRLGLLGQFVPAMPLTIDEIERHGISFNKEFFCQPIINDAVLEKIFGEKASEVKEKYLTPTNGNSYQLKPEYSSQDKIDEHIAYEEDKPEVERLRKGLYLLCCQVLFIEDYKVAGTYHPRIALDQSAAFGTLPQDLQNKLRDIYEDFYYHRHNDFWKASAEKKLTPIIESTDMMVCGEDLGMVPMCVPTVMSDLEILSLEIQRMPKEPYVEFGTLSKVPKTSVCTTSTHDMSTMRQWWEEDRSSVQRYFGNELHQYGTAPQFCEPWICRLIIENHLKSPASWVILPIQDWMATDGNVRWDQTFKERINDPGNPNNYWRYRMHIKIEDLIKNENFNEVIRHLIQEGGR